MAPLESAGKRKTRAPSSLSNSICETDDMNGYISSSPDVSEYVESEGDDSDVKMTDKKKKATSKITPSPGKSPSKTSSTSPRGPRATPTLATWSEKETAIVVNKLAEIILDHRTEVYSVPALKQWSGNGGSAINQRIKQILSKSFGPMGYTLKVPAGTKRGGSGGGTAGSPSKKAKCGE